MKKILILTLALGFTYLCQAQEKFSKSGKPQDEVACKMLEPELRGFNSKCINTPITTSGFEYNLIITYWDFYVEDLQQKKALDDWLTAESKLDPKKSTGKDRSEFRRKYGEKPQLMAKCDKSIPNHFSFLKNQGLSYDVVGFAPLPHQDKQRPVNCQLTIRSKEPKIFCSPDFKNMFQGQYLIGGVSGTEGQFFNGKVLKLEIKSTGKKYPVTDEVFTSIHGSVYNNLNFIKDICPKL